jgi:hypothetical protein
MAITQQSTVVGVFGQRADATQCIAELRGAGFTDEQLGFIGRHGVTRPMGDRLDRTPGPNEETEGEEGAGVGTAVGATVGGLAAIAMGMIPGAGPFLAAGTLAATVFGVAAGATAGALAGALVGLGIPEAEARYYESEAHAGRYLVTVRAGGRAAEARAIMDRHSAYGFASREVTTATR